MALTPNSWGGVQALNRSRRRPSPGRKLCCATEQPLRLQRNQTALKSRPPHPQQVAYNHKLENFYGRMAVGFMDPLEKNAIRNRKLTPTATKTERNTEGNSSIKQLADFQSLALSFFREQASQELLKEVIPSRPPPAASKGGALCSWGGPGPPAPARARGDVGRDVMGTSRHAVRRARERYEG